jgi:D-amino-acid dehydrogenase
VLGPSRATPDVIYAFGHSHVGMIAAPVTGKVVADLATRPPPSIDIMPFSVGPFA